MFDGVRPLPLSFCSAAYVPEKSGLAPANAIVVRQKANKHSFFIGLRILAPSGTVLIRLGRHFN
jgi:hypothetical protein